MIPGNLRITPRLSRWITVHKKGNVSVWCGKVELGQGIHTALAQIVAEELDVALHRIRMIPLSTPVSPDENLTAGSRSLEDSGTALRQACAEVRARFLAAAATRLGSGDLTIDSLKIVDGVISSSEGSTSYWELADVVSLDVDATGEAEPKPPTAYRVVGSQARRLDLPDKISGKPRYIHDLDLPGILYGRIVRPPSPGATLRELDTSAAKSLAGVVEIVRDGSFLGIVATQEETAIAGADLLRSGAKWDEAAQLPGSVGELLTAGPFDTMTVSESGTPGLGRTVTARYSRPYLAHASIAPSCGIALWNGANLEVWSHTQGAYGLRQAISLALPLTTDQITVHHVEGAGCYGHNGADDAAFDAVLLARAVPGQPVQVVWSRADELSWAPFGTAMAVQLSAQLTEDGSIVAWQHEVFGNGHTSRPGATGAPALLSAAYMSDPKPIPVSVDPPTARGGGAQRNGVPMYEFPHHKVVKSRLLTMPLRTSALRGLGAFINVFAIESFMDELAGEVDPVEFRLRYLRDDRARMTVLAAADRSGWWDRQPTGDHGFGFGFARYSNHGAYCAVVAEIHASSEVRVEQLTIAVDAGQIVNPDGLRNQIEGGAIQSTSWTVKEQVRFDQTRVTSNDWESYPILRFSEVPAVEVVLLDQPGQPYLGAGEAAQGPTAAAIANALHNALGVRVRDLPLTPENIVKAMP
jgi:CO/xanthine dehydrogenase Mo-binding subunit